MNASRRSFFFKGLGAVAAFLGLGRYLGGCSSQTGPTTGGNCLANGTSISIGGNHGHTVTIPISDISSTSAKQYTLTAASTDGHTHQVTISASDFASLRNNTGVQDTSTFDSGNTHTHAVTVNCA